LEYVLAVARELHFGRAAERVHVVQSSVSRQVREVEAEVGFEIFRPNNHLVDLTEAGREFVLAVNDMMARFDAEFKRARDRSRLIARRNATSCLIGYSPFVPATLRHEIRSIRDMRFPSIRLQFRLATESEMADSLGRGFFKWASPLRRSNEIICNRSRCAPNPCAPCQFASIPQTGVVRSDLLSCEHIRSLFHVQGTRIPRCIFHGFRSKTASLRR
jgi:hypothetical protein